jgi:hypothetical protein
VCETERVCVWSRVGACLLVSCMCVSESESVYVFGHVLAHVCFFFVFFLDTCWRMLVRAVLFQHALDI